MRQALTHRRLYTSYQRVLLFHTHTYIQHVRTTLVHVHSFIYALQTLGRCSLFATERTRRACGFIGCLPLAEWHARQTIFGRLGEFTYNHCTYIVCRHEMPCACTCIYMYMCTCIRHEMSVHAVHVHACTFYNHCQVYVCTVCKLTSAPTSSTALVAASIASNLALSVAMRDPGMFRLMRSVRTLTPTCR